VLNIEGRKACLVHREIAACASSDFAREPVIAAGTIIEAVPRKQRGDAQKHETRAFFVSFTAAVFHLERQRFVAHGDAPSPVVAFHPRRLRVIPRRGVSFPAALHRTGRRFRSPVAVRPARSDVAHLTTALT
jgi:hypothetical protein